MPVTTQDAVYRGILADLQAGLSDTLADNFIYVAPLETFTQENERCVQLIPGVPVALEPVSGTGLITEEFRVCYWQRLWLDQARQSTQRITNATLGILKVIAEARATLIQGDGDGTATVPIVFVRGSTFTESDQHAGWVHANDTFRVGYEIAWEVPSG